MPFTLGILCIAGTFFMAEQQWGVPDFVEKDKRHRPKIVKGAMNVFGIKKSMESEKTTQQQTQQKEAWVNESTTPTHHGPTNTEPASEKEKKKKRKEQKKKDSNTTPPPLTVSIDCMNGL